MTPRTQSHSGVLDSRVGFLTLDDVRDQDARLRGSTPEARTGVWIDETPQGVSIRMVDLTSGRVVYADNITPRLEWTSRQEKNFSIARDVQRRARGESLTHSFFDFGAGFGTGPLIPIYVGFDWTEQWGGYNENLTGISFSLTNPIFGLGGTYYRALPNAFNMLLGGKVMLSLPGALVTAVSGQTTEVFDPLVQGMGFVRLPIPLWDGMYGAFGFAAAAPWSGHLAFGIGLSTLNTSILPVLP